MQIDGHIQTISENTNLYDDKAIVDLFSRANLQQYGGRGLVMKGVNVPSKNESAGHDLKSEGVEGGGGGGGGGGGEELTHNDILIFSQILWRCPL